MCSDNLSGEPDNQQGRLEAYLSGFADGEGTFSVGITRRPDLRAWVPARSRVPGQPELGASDRTGALPTGIGLRADPGEQHPELPRPDAGLRRPATSSSVGRVIPFFHRNPLLSEKRRSFEIFETIVTAMAAGRHRTATGFEELVEMAFSTNGDGVLPTVAYRGRDWQQEPSETVRRTTPRNPGLKSQSELHGDMQSQAEMTWPLASRIGGGSNNTVGPYPSRA